MTPNPTRGSDCERDPYFALSATRTDSELKAYFPKTNVAEVLASPVISGPEVVADAAVHLVQTPLSGKVNGTASDQAPQCASPSPTPSPTTINPTTSLLGPSSPVGSSPGEKPSTPSSACAPPTRQPRRAAAKLGSIALEKTWEGRKSKGRKDKLTEVEKFSAAIWHVAASKGTAVSLNLGFRRESMLWSVEAPKRRMMQNLHKHLSAAGFGRLPYAFAFEITPATEGHRVHLHGVIDTSGLTAADTLRVETALRHAASFASGPIGGERQLDLAPLHKPAGWVDYALKNRKRTAHELGLDDTVFMNDPMRRLAKDYYQRFRNEVIQQFGEPTSGIKKKGKSLSEQKLKGVQGFTYPAKCDRVTLSGERDKALVGGAPELHLRRPHQPALRTRKTHPRAANSRRSVRPSGSPHTQVLSMRPCSSAVSGVATSPSA